MINKATKSVKAGVKATTKTNTLFKAFGVKGPEEEVSIYDTKVDVFGDGKFDKDQITISSWNLNGIRAVKRKGMFEPYFKTDHFDIICYNETKIAEDTAKEVDIYSWFPEWYQYWSYAFKKGYSGTAILSKVKPISVQYGLG